METSFQSHRIRDGARNEIIGGRPPVAHGIQRPFHAGERRAGEKRHDGEWSMPESWLEVVAGKSGSVLWRGRAAGADAPESPADFLPPRGRRLDSLRRV